MTKDRIKKGEVAIFFGGDAAWHQLCWLVLPLLLAFYLCVVVGATCVSTRRTSTIAAYFSQVTHDHSSRELQQRHGVVLRVLNTLIRPVCALGSLGTMLMILNLLSPQMCGDSGGCGSDPFIRTTSASIRQQPSVAYQYCWVILSCTVTAVLIYSIQELCRSKRVRQAELLVETLTIVVESNLLHHNAIAEWQEKAGVRPDRHRVELPRRVLVIVLTIPLMILTAFPAFGFVMSKK